jgi:hypothetical protein
MTQMSQQIRINDDIIMLGGSSVLAAALNLPSMVNLILFANTHLTALYLSPLCSTAVLLFASSNCITQVRMAGRTLEQHDTTV